MRTPWWMLCGVVALALAVSAPVPAQEAAPAEGEAPPPAETPARTAAPPPASPSAPPAGVTRELVLSKDRTALESWWSDFGLGDAGLFAKWRARPAL